MINTLDAIGSLERVSFEEVMVPDLGSIQTFEADIQVEADGDDYVFLASRIYTHQIDGEGEFDFLPAKTDTSVQLGIELAFREHVESNKAYEFLCEQADEDTDIKRNLLRAA